MRYNYRLRPGALAVRALEAEWHRCRFLWNEAVYQQKIGNRPTYQKLSKMLTEARGRCAWLRDGSQVTQQCTLRTYALALDHSLRIKGRGRPASKTRRTALPSFEYTSKYFSVRGHSLKLSKIVPIPIVWSRDLPSIPSSVRIYRDSLGHWYASFVVRRDAEPMPEATGAIGIDWGVAVTATTTDPEFDLPCAGHRRRCAAELAKAQRKMCRRRRPRGHKPTVGYQTARRSVSKLHKKAARQNRHTARVWSSKVVANHQLVAIEDFRSGFLKKTTMARKAVDAAIGSIKQELLYRAKRAGRKVVLVPPAYTTMTCSSCFARNKQALKLSERVFRCEHCGYYADRDRNAAGVILAVAERDHVGVEGARRFTDSLRIPDEARPEPKIFAA